MQQIITDTLLSFDGYDNSYLVQCKINLDMSQIFMIREACDLDIPDMRDIVLSDTYTGPKKLHREDFTVIVLNTGTEHTVRIAYYDLMVMLTKDSSVELKTEETDGGDIL